MIKIDKGVPVPRGCRGRPSIYPFKEMEVGDSFLITGPLPYLRKVRNSVSSGANHARPFKFRIRLTEEGLRCWRVE